MQLCNTRHNTINNISALALTPTPKGVSQERKRREGVKGSRLQTLDLSEEGVSQGPKRGEGTRVRFCQKRA